MNSQYIKIITRSCQNYIRRNFSSFFFLLFTYFFLLLYHTFLWYTIRVDYTSNILCTTIHWIRIESLCVTNWGHAISTFVTINLVEYVLQLDVRIIFFRIYFVLGLSAGRTGCGTAVCAHTHTHTLLFVCVRYMHVACIAYIQNTHLYI